MGYPTGTARTGTAPRAVVALLLALGAGVLWWVSGGGPAAPPPDAAAVDAPLPGGPGVGDPVAGERAAPVEVDPAAGRTDTLGRRAGLEVVGRVVDRDGRPVPGSVVSWNGPGEADVDVTTDADGGFVARGLVAGSHQVIASGSQQLTHAEFVDVLPSAAAPQQVTLVVDRGIPLSGRVVDIESRPIDGARVTPWRRGPSGEELDARSAVVTDAAGVFRIWGDARATTFVLVERDGYVAAKGRLAANQAPTIVLARRAN